MNLPNNIINPYTSSWQNCQIPILIIAFKRHSLLKSVLSQIAKLNPSKLYFAIDGPKNDNDIIDVNKTKGVISEYSKHFNSISVRSSDVNIGCQRWVSSSITWFFEHESFGIIIEEDILIDTRFIEWCTGLKNIRVTNPSIMHLNSFTPDSIIKRNKSHLTKYSTSWGWATWKECWNLYSDDIVELPNSFFRRFFYIKKLIDCDIYTTLYYTLALEMARQQKLSTWAFRWNLTIWKNNGFALSPNINLSENIGITKEASHTSKELHLLEFKIADKSKMISFEVDNRNKIIDNKIFRSIMKCDDLFRLLRMLISSYTPNKFFFIIRKFFR